MKLDSASEGYIQGRFDILTREGSKKGDGGFGERFMQARHDAAGMTPEAKHEEKRSKMRELVQNPDNPVNREVNPCHSQTSTQPEITAPEYQRYTRKEITPGVSQVYGWNGNKGAVQAYRFSKDKFTAAEAKAWLKSHDVKWIMFEARERRKVGRE